MMLMSQVNVFLTLSTYNIFLFSKPLFASFGIFPSKAFGSQGVPIIIGFSLASALLTPLETVVSFAVNSFSRRLEFAADAFAVKLGYKDELKGGLVSMMAKNSSIYDVDPLYSALHHSHPTLAERLVAIDASEAGRKQE
jgi:STE24 endopeptidase